MNAPERKTPSETSNKRKKNRINGVTITIVCPSCEKKYDIDKGKIPKNERLVARCRNCGYRFPIVAPTGKIDESRYQIRGAASDLRPAARTIAVSLSKGGVGKTTTAVNLSAGLALAGFKVLLLDTDTQGQDSYMLGINAPAGLTEFLYKELDADKTIIEARANLWLLAGGKSLAGVKRLIDRKDFGGEMTLAEALIPLETQYDYIIIDTSPGWDPLTVNVLFYVKEILVPVALEVMALQGLIEFTKSLSSIQKYRKEVSLKYILPTFHNKRVNSPISILEKLRELYGDIVCDPIRYDPNISDAPAYGQTVFEFAPGSNCTTDYRDLIRKVANDKDLLK